MRAYRLQHVAVTVLILSCAAYGLTVVALHKPTAKPTVSPSTTHTPSPTPTSGAKLIWSDEFTGAAGLAPAASKWNHDVGGNGWGNAEWEYYTDSTQNAALDGAGHLVITSRRPDHPAGLCATGPCNITSARLQTDGNFTTTYGRIEARLKTPAGQGLWPAFWMVAADDSGEIDIMEQNGRDPGVVSGSAHIYKYTPTDGLTAEFALPSATTDFHDYAVDWSPDKITWSVDGRVFHTVSKSDPQAAHWVFDRPYYLLLNLAVGSDDPGYPDASTPFPAKLVVDYVRVYK